MNILDKISKDLRKDVRTGIDRCTELLNGGMDSTEAIRTIQKESGKFVALMVANAYLRYYKEIAK